MPFDVFVELLYLAIYHSSSLNKKRFINPIIHTILIRRKRVKEHDHYLLVVRISHFRSIHRSQNVVISSCDFFFTGSRDMLFIKNVISNLYENVFLIPY